MLVASLAQGEERPAGGNSGFGWDRFESEPPAQFSGSDPVMLAANTIGAVAADTAANMAANMAGSAIAAPPYPAAAESAQPAGAARTGEPVLVASLGGWGGPAAPAPSGPPSAYHDAPGPLPAAAGTRYADPAPRPLRPAMSLHLDDASSATGYVGNRVQSMALSLDTVLPRSGGLTIQPRVQLAYQPAPDRSGAGFLGSQPADASAAEVLVRVYRTQPTRLNGANGVYPFVEADLWQDHKQAININGTRIDPDMLRGLLSVNVGAHGSTNGGVKLWIKLKGGRNAGGTLGARYRW
ncbi:hypothetical protein ACKI2N_027925 [Cupriavidus sp. 30B13]|uniref:hypothetical protein n=1 Tax=Cupriavidus sp. 30B13 TaxID=3384241 RepID=UPI003B91B03E